MSAETIHVGIDDTDSKEGMCTTYVGAIAIHRLKEMGANLVGFPHLIRLNPLWIHKTRGNCSISFAIQAKKSQFPQIKRTVVETVGELAELHVEETTPGVVFFEGAEIPGELRSYSARVVREVVTLEEAENLAGKIGAEIHKFRAGRGVIGALAAIGHPLEDDYTYELITYRTEENRGTPRRIDEESVREMNEATYPGTFDNLDLETGEIRITPHTPGPILYGIRSEAPEAAFEAQEMVRKEEPIERALLYKTNQGTDEHLQPAKIGDIEPYQSVIVEGKVSEGPETITGGHVFFRIEDSTGEVNCAAFEPTRRFRDVTRKLLPGDEVRVQGGVKEKPKLPLTINLEKIEVLRLRTAKKKANPICENCGKRMTSAGEEKGYVCKRCGVKLPAGSSREVEVDRSLETGLYEVPPRARRHLAKPLVRMEEG